MDFRNRHIDLVGKQNLWFGISLAIILVGLFSWLAFGLNLGIDFRGGAQLQYRIPAAQRPAAGQEAALLGRVGQLLEAPPASLRGTRRQVVGGDTLVVSTAALTPQERDRDEKAIQTALQPILGTNARPISSDFVGAVIGQELRRNAIWGVLMGVSFIALWICVRYSFNGLADGIRYAVAGVAALVHDVFVLIGLFALIGHFFPRVEIDSSFIAALLTVVGYSINDSVVIFDRIRENLRTRRRDPFLQVVNDSLLETMSRSINTGLTVLIMLFVLLLFGGESIFNFVLAMLVGIASGLYSSIFNASMVLVAWHRWDEKKALAAREARLAPATSRTPTGSGTRPAARPAATPRPASAPRTPPVVRPAVPREVAPIEPISSSVATIEVAPESSVTLAPLSAGDGDESAPRENGVETGIATGSETARPVAPPRAETTKARARRRY